MEVKYKKWILLWVLLNNNEIQFSGHDLICWCSDVSFLSPRGFCVGSSAQRKNSAFPFYELYFKGDLERVFSVSVCLSILKREKKTKHTSFEFNWINTLALLDLIGTYRDG